MTPLRALTIGLVLTATAGFSDGLGFLALGGFYTSFMSGNTTQLGAGVASGAWSAALLSGSLVVLFFIGSFLGSFAAHSSRRFGQLYASAIVLIGVLLSLSLSAGGYSPAQSLLSLAAAAGAQNAILQPIGAARLGATFVTGTLFAAGQDLARATTGAAPRWRWLQHLVVWAALCVGAVLGAVGYSRWHMGALSVPAAVYAVCCCWLGARAYRQG